VAGLPVRKIAIVVTIAFSVSGAFTAASACNLFDLTCNVGKSIEKSLQDVGKSVERRAQDTGHSIEKGAQDTGKPNEFGQRGEVAQSPTNPCKVNPTLPQCGI
jgi:hypothetical protein